MLTRRNGRPAGRRFAARCVTKFVSASPDRGSTRGPLQSPYRENESCCYPQRLMQSRPIDGVTALRPCPRRNSLRGPAEYREVLWVIGARDTITTVIVDCWRKPPTNKNGWPSSIC